MNPVKIIRIYTFYNFKVNQSKKKEYNSHSANKNHLFYLIYNLFKHYYPSMSETILSAFLIMKLQKFF